MEQIPLNFPSAYLTFSITAFWLSSLRTFLHITCFLFFYPQANKPRSPILAILQDETSEPYPAHQGRNQNEVAVRQLRCVDKENRADGLITDTTRCCIQGLLTCARLALESWSSEPQVITSATTLIEVFSRNSPNP